MKKNRLTAFLYLTLLWSAQSHSYPPPTDPLVRIHYDYSVAGYCSLVSAAVAAGFQRQLKALLAQQKVDQMMLDEARATAWKAVDKEWQNRGLGGFKAWCSSAGAASVQRFADDINEKN